MTLNEISRIRLSNQQITKSKFRSVKDIVGWMGAIQAQDYLMSKWAIGLRLPGSTDKMVEAAIDKGDILRTHLMRPTWHFVSSEDINWLLELTAPRIRSTLKRRHEELELTESLLSRTNSIIQNLLRGNNHLIREEIVSELKKLKIKTTENRASHILLWSELNGISCSGTIKNNKQTYALLEERIHDSKNIIRDEALGKIAFKYFSSHGPATLKDFSWWSGLSAKDAVKALEMVKSHFISEKEGSQIFWVSSSPVASKENNDVHLLPAYDEFLISYNDRTASLPLIKTRDTISSNGIFYPTILVEGQVRGLWKRKIRNNEVAVEIKFFHGKEKKLKGSIERAAAEYGSFLGKITKIEV